MELAAPESKNQIRTPVCVAVAARGVGDLARMRARLADLGKPIPKIVLASSRNTPQDDLV
jgi:hypothetical protein